MNPNQMNTFFDSATPAEINGLAEGQTLQNQLAEPQEEVVEQELNTVEAIPPILASTTALPEAAVEETPQQLRFRDLREAKLKAEWERDDMARQIQELRSRSQPQAAPEPEDDDDYGVGEDDLVEGKHLAKIVKAVEKKVERRINKQYAQQNAQTQQQLVENRLRQEFPDIDKVLGYSSQLAAQEPELARSLIANTDSYSQLKATYQMIKKLGIIPAEPTQDRQKIQQNMAKPKAVQSVTPRQSGLLDISQYDGNLSEEQKAAIWAETRRLAR